ncbi:MAG: pyridoxal-phosphate dependent enzyme [Aggregatilineales bacterium]
MNAHAASPTLICPDCGRAARPLDWHCDGRPLEIAGAPPFNAAAIDASAWSMWRYAAALPVARRVSLGEGLTPLVLVEVGAMRFHAKLEYLNPTGSYKDRGTAALLSHLLAHGVEAVVEDSSGNAGASLAAYCAAAGVRAQVYVPAGAPAGKKRLIERFGAALVAVPGPRAAATAAVRQAAQNTPYASHAWSPYFIAGQMTCAWEIWEQLGRRAPDAIVCPVGYGGLLLGLARGFRALLDAGLIERLPRLYAAQSSACDPLVRAWERGGPVEAVEQGQTVADGIAVTLPLRAAEVLAALRDSGGGALRVSDEAVLAAQAALARRGLLAEPTGAVGVAALADAQRLAGANAAFVVPLTGSGLKAL